MSLDVDLIIKALRYFARNHPEYKVRVEKELEFLKFFTLRRLVQKFLWGNKSSKLSS